MVRTRHDPLQSHGGAKHRTAYGQAVGIPNVHIHQTRYAFAAEVANVAASLHDVQAALNHENLATTRVYVDRIRVQEDRFGTTIDAAYGLSEREAPEDAAARERHP